ncbi:MAG TPA: hypothetical protein VKZ92_06260 [Pseudohongiella sp.]|nr:hypothetical protein [Pseudohongiella sp.]
MTKTPQREIVALTTTSYLQHKLSLLSCRCDRMSHRQPGRCLAAEKEDGGFVPDFVQIVKNKFDFFSAMAVVGGAGGAYAECLPLRVQLRYIHGRWPLKIIHSAMLLTDHLNIHPVDTGIKTLQLYLEIIAETTVG